MGQLDRTVTIGGKVRGVNAYQLSCGHWQSDKAAYGIGGVFVCCDHGRAVVIGVAGPASFLFVP